MSWTSGIGITHKYHSDFIEMKELPCDLEVWWQLQCSFGGNYDQIEVDPEWASLTTKERLSKFYTNNQIDEEFIVFEGKYITFDEIPFIDYDNGEEIKFVVCKLSVHF